MRNGILAGGNYIIDYVKLINSYPEQDMLADSGRASRNNESASGMCDLWHGIQSSTIVDTPGQFPVG